MQPPFGTRIFERVLTRRDFLKLTALTTTAGAAGCAVNPVTGQNQLMLVSRQQEIGIDRQNGPHQFSADYGPCRDPALNGYLNRVGMDVARTSHRPDMPYSFRGVNANYVNAYAFPGGSIAATRGILVELDNEAELAGLLGHEIGHVNARHTAQRMSQSMLIGALGAGVGLALGSENGELGAVTGTLFGLGSGLLLARYSRDNEREADRLGMEYMVRAGHNPQGMVGLMDLLRSKSRRTPSALETMFSTHPMSEERYRTAVQNAQTTHAGASGLPLNRSRYMDNTASLRRIKPAITAFEQGEKEMGAKQYPRAETKFRKGLRIAPDDYAGLVLMSKCQVAMDRPDQARAYAEKAKQVYPGEAQALHVAGISKLMTNRYGQALAEFTAYEQALPGNPNTIFLKGVSYEGMQRRQQAAEEYLRFLQQVKQGPQAQHAYERLKAWKVI
jgi:predicted Zn-dependent protease